ncbi:MAG: hypothetical protein Q7R59_02170 [bacterium]|nr:hypothetical protein [bacterium]
MDKNVRQAWGENTLKSFIDRTTMYRLMLYYLLILFAVATFLYDPLALIWSALVITAFAWLADILFARIFGAVSNRESIFITALVLVFIMSPVAFTDIAGSIALIVIAAAAAASKYILAIGKKHIFNPAAIAAVLSAFVLGIPATWWVAGSIVLLSFVCIGGLIVVYKLRRFDLILSFGISAFVTVALTSSNPIFGIQEALFYLPLFFFTFIMLTEPQTTPPTRSLRIMCGALVGLLFIPAMHIGSFYFSPELALIIGNLFSYFVSPKGRAVLTLVGRRPLASGIYEYLFRPDRHLHFKPGQYLEWTLGEVPLDNRGNRRFFTIASAPEDEEVALGVRFYDKPSAFKRTLANLPVNGAISVASLGGDFVMPRDKERKLAFLAGGIGVTPFASMARHCIASGENRDATLLYASKADDEIAYRDVFARAEHFGWRTLYQIGIIDAELIKREVPDYAERLFYISGPPGMVDAMKRVLLNLGVSRFNIKTDFFPGLA